MKERLGDILQTVIAALVAAGTALCAYRCHQEPPESPETVVETRVDTLVVRDTIRIAQPVPVAVRVTDTVFITVPAPAEEDSVLYVPVTLEERVYEDPDSTYRAVVSGPAIERYRPKLDTIEVYRKTVYVDRIQTVTVEPPRWSVGLQAGYGVSKDGLSPYVGVGVQYRLWAPKRRKAPP